MPPNRRPMRYAHSDGHTDVCYSEDGKYILTCGSDGDVRIWAGLEDDDSTSQCVGEKAMAVTQKGDYFYVGTDNNNVQAYTFPEPSRDQIVTRFSATVTHVVISNSGKKLVSGSCDTEIHVTDLETSQTQVLTGHTAPILSVAIDPKEKYVASSSCDGTARAWSLDQSPPSAVHTWRCVPGSNSFHTAEVLCRPAWQPPNGRYLALPDARQLRLFERDTWNSVAMLSDERATKAFSICAFSPCGQYIAGSTTGGDICVWEVNSQSLVARVQHAQRLLVCSLAWNPAGNGEIAYCDFSGQLGTIEDCLSPDASVTAFSSTPEHSAVATIGFDNEEDEDSENVISLEKIKASVPLPTAEGSVTGDDIDLPSIPVMDDDTESKFSAPAVRPLGVELQPPFQPSSTPAHLQYRFMVWNSVGIVRCSNTEEENAIDVEFHDASVHHSIRLPNFLKHSIASLTDEVLVLACEGDEDSPSKMVCVLLSSWDGAREWTVEMPSGEEVLAVSAGRGWVAAASDVRHLRLFTIAGSQREVLSLPGPIVCLASRDRLLLVICHSGAGLVYSVMTVGEGAVSGVKRFEPLPLAPSATLSWAGFSDEGSPCTVDSSGLVRLLTRRGYWTPVCDTSSQCSGKSDHYFVLGLSERYQAVRCVLCKGARYPPTMPRPVVVELSLKIPLCEQTTEKAELEEKLWRSRLVLDSLDVVSRTDESYNTDKDDIEVTIKETLIKLFALACKSGLERRAVELGALMGSQHVLQLAVKYATKVGKRHLAERLTEEAAKRQREHPSPEITAVMSAAPASRFFLEASERTSSPEIIQNGWSDANGEAVMEDYDPFASTPSPAGIVDQGSLLLAAKQKKNAVEIRPSLSLSLKKHNPFKKSSEQQEIGKGLTKMNSAFIQQVNSKNKQTVVEPAQQTSKVKQTTLTGKQAEPSAKKAPLSFTQWFSEEKPNMQAEFPDMSSSELIREAMKRYKEVSLKHKEEQQPKLGSFVQWFSDEKANLQKEFPELTPQQLTTEGLKRYRDLTQKKKEVSAKTDSGDSSETMNETKKRKAEEDSGSKEKVAKAYSLDLSQYRLT